MSLKDHGRGHGARPAGRGYSPRGASCTGRRRCTPARPPRCGATAWWWWSGSWHRTGPLGGRQTATQDTSPSNLSARQVLRLLPHRERRGAALLEWAVGRAIMSLREHPRPATAPQPFLMSPSWRGVCVCEQDFCGEE